jgi:hypothetical protein
VAQPDDGSCLYFSLGYEPGGSQSTRGEANALRSKLNGWILANQTTDFFAHTVRVERVFNVVIAGT